MTDRRTKGEVLISLLRAFGTLLADFSDVMPYRTIQSLRTTRSFRKVVTSATGSVPTCGHSMTTSSAKSSRIWPIGHPT